MMLTRRIAQELLGRGTYASFHDSALSYADADGLFDK
jgi:hypothetical protein